jgi:hypothetical protein
MIVATLAAWFFLPVKNWIETFSQWIEGLGLCGGVVFVGAYVALAKLFASVFDPVRRSKLSTA